MTSYTVKQVADRYCVGEHKILAWIRSGQLKAFSVGTNPESLKPRWRISETSLAEFESSRQAIPDDPPVGRIRRRRESSVIDRY